MRFSFIHAADLHIDSPLDALGCKDAAVAARFAQAGRRAVEALVDATIEAKAAFLLICGDIFDGDWRDVSTGLFFAKALSRLDRAEIPAFIVKGNHDAENLMSKSLAYPSSVNIFNARGAHTLELEALRVALHGRSFGARLVDGDFVSTYPARRDGWFNIGLLHTALDGARGHDSYAPCSLDDLKRFGYDYWALGHVHAAEAVCEDPYIVYPGNIQGRSVRETGPKGAMRVDVADGRVVSLTPIALDAARWAHAHVDVADCQDEAQTLAMIEARLKHEHAGAEGRPLALRLTLVGETPLHERLVVRRETLEAEARACGFRFAEDFWVERLKLATQPPRARRAALSATDALDAETLVLAAADAHYEREIAALVDDIAKKMPAELRERLKRELDAETLAKEARDLLLGEIALATSGL